MPKTNVLTQTRYSKLLKDIRKLIAEGREQATLAVNQGLVQTYWNVGKRISNEGLVENAGYGEAVLRDIAEELNIDYTTLTRSVRFFRTYNIAPRGNYLNWSHYRALLPIHDKAQRQWYENLAADEKFTAPQLGKAIKEERYEQSQKNKGKKVRIQKLKRPTEATYVYKAYVERVIDGDTLYLRVDLGFQVFKEQRIRLASIDCEPADTPKGKEAYRYVRDQLAKVDFVMLKTNKIDIYGRYVGDVFYSFKERSKDKIFMSGRYLNQELADRGLARIL